MVLIIALAAVAGSLGYWVRDRLRCRRIGRRRGRGRAADASSAPPVVPAEEPPLDDAATLFEPPSSDPDATAAEPDVPSDATDTGPPPEGGDEER